MSYRILIADDHPLIASGMKALLQKMTDYSIDMVHNWSNLWAALSFPVDLLILDLNIHGKNSINFIEKIKAQQPRMSILVFSSYNKPSLVRKAFEKGVQGYVLKDTVDEELLEAIQTIFKGNLYVGTRVAFSKNRGLKQETILEDSFLRHNKLTKREIQIVELMIKGLENQEIAEQLFISKHTVQTHRKNIYKKVGVHSVVELIQALNKR